MVTGHSNGEVAMWTPNMASKPVVRMLAHTSAPLTSLSVSQDGNYLLTTAKDSRFKVWDIRTYKCLHDYFSATPALSSDFSGSGLISLCFNNEIQVWKNVANEKQKMPYMKHRLPKSQKISDCRFVPYEDVMGMATSNGFSSILVPGSGL